MSEIRSFASPSVSAPASHWRQEITIDLHRAATKVVYGDSLGPRLDPGTPAQCPGTAFSSHPVLRYHYIPQKGEYVKLTYVVVKHMHLR